MESGVSGCVCMYVCLQAPPAPVDSALFPKEMTSSPSAPKSDDIIPDSANQFTNVVCTYFCCCRFLGGVDR